MYDIDIAVQDDSSGRNSLLQVVKGCAEDSSGVSHAMVPITFTNGNAAQDVTVVNRAIFKHDVTTNKQGVASLVMQVKIPYTRVVEATIGSGSSAAGTQQAVATKDYISCHVVLALPKSMLTDWRDSNKQRVAEVQLNTALTILTAWCQQYGVLPYQWASAINDPDNLRIIMKRPRVDSANPSAAPQVAETLAVQGSAGGRATAFYMPVPFPLRDPLADPLMSMFNGVCADVKPVPLANY